MNIFGVGGAEIAVIIMIMLIVAGPKRMIRWAYVIGQWIGKFRIFWEQMVDVMQDEVDQAGLDVTLPREMPTRQNLARSAQQFLKPYSDSLQQTLDDVERPFRESIQEAEQVMAAARNDLERPRPASGQSPPDATSTPPVSQDPADSPATFGAWSQPRTPAQRQEQEV